MDNYKNFLFGGLSGLSQVVVGYPFDTLKVMTQNKIKLNNTNINSLFRGIKYPIYSNILINSLLFSSYHKQSTNNHFLSGMISGFMITPIVYTSDLFKVKRQINKELKPIYKMFSYQGLFITSMRESLAFGMYFYTYENMKQYGFHPLISGGFSGLTNWTLTYPIDVIRNRQIASNISLIESVKMGNFWRGYFICALRAILVNSVGFYVFELQNL
jgi:solute carrier family 25 carnitine/acylcarnitine transporter 20/29